MSRKAPFTVLIAEQQWSQTDTECLAAQLPASIWKDHQHPKHLILPGRVAEDTIRAALPEKSFSVRSVKGTANLPFQIPPRRPRPSA